jgi:SAM-dependent methyltransferase
MTRPENDTTKPAGIIRLANSFCDAKALMTAVELDLFSLLHVGPATAEGICEALSLDGRGATDWLDLLTELDLLVCENGQYANAAGSGQFLVRGDDDYIGGFIERTNRNLYPAWGNLAEALRTGKPQSGSSFTAVVNNPNILRQFIGSMDALTKDLGPALIATYTGWNAYKSVLDVGGCRGSLVTQIVKEFPHLAGHAFDLPQMEPFFVEQLAQQEIDGSVTFHGGDFFADPLPTADLIVMGHVLHDWDRDQREFLIAKAYESLNSGGTLLIYDRMLDRTSSRVENLVISLDMLLVTDGGSEYSVQEVREHAKKAGFVTATDVLLGEDDTLVIATKS